MCTRTRTADSLIPGPHHVQPLIDKARRAASCPPHISSCTSLTRAAGRQSVPAVPPPPAPRPLDPDAEDLLRAHDDALARAYASTTSSPPSSPAGPAGTAYAANPPSQHTLAPPHDAAERSPARRRGPLRAAVGRMADLSRVLRMARPT